MASKIEIFQPIIVFDGLLYEAELGKDERLTRIDKIVLMNEYRRTEMLSSLLPIQICTVEYFPHLLDEIESKLADAASRALAKGKSGLPWVEEHRALVSKAVVSLNPSEEENLNF